MEYDNGNGKLNQERSENYSNFQFGMEEKFWERQNQVY
jgi:hypothetical protein